MTALVEKAAPRASGRGVTVCNRVDCSKPLAAGRSFCPLTNAYYCPACAERINQICGAGTCKPVNLTRRNLP